MRPRKIFMRITIIEWFIYGGLNCGRAKMFNLSQLGIESRLLGLQANTQPRRCKSWLLPCVILYLDPVTYTHCNHYNRLIEFEICCIACHYIKLLNS